MSALVQHRTFSPGDPSSLGLPGWDWSTVQTSPGRLGGKARDLYLPQLQLHEERFEAVTTNHFGVPPAESIAVSVSANPEQAALVNGRVWRAGVCVWTRDTEVNVRVPPMCLYTVILKKQAFLENVWELEHVDLTPHLKSFPKICNNRCLSDRLAYRLGSLISACSQDDSSAPIGPQINEVQAEILDYLLPVIVDILAATARRPRAFKAQAKTVRDARQYILEHLHGPVHVSQLCHALGVSRRQLQSSFNDVVGMTPIPYIRALRLGKIQESLMRGEEGCSVRDVASRWGFLHHGRFSQAYRAMFGESPSSTLRRTAHSPSLRV